MSAIFGVLGLGDSERVYLSTLGQRVVYDAVTQVLTMHNEEMTAALAVFIEEMTDNHKRRYLLPGGGRLQRRGGSAQSGAIKRTGKWDVAFPLEEFGDQIAANRVSFGYMTVQDLDKHMDTVVIQDLNTVRFELLYALLNNTQRSFDDELWGALSIEPLANGDAVLYPPVLGVEDQAAENHYLESGYAASAISDSNDPIVTIVNEMEEHFGAVTGNSDIVVFINNAQSAKVKALADFTAVTDRRIVVGDNATTVVSDLPNVPGRILGRHAAGAWIAEWRWIPANYMIGIHLDAPPPLIQRVDPAYTNLGTGLQLVSESDVYPFEQSHYEHRLGFGVGNRLNGVVMELGTGGTFSIPAAYA